MKIKLQEFKNMCEDLYPFEDLEALNDDEHISSLLNSKLAKSFEPIALLGSQGVIAKWKAPKGGEPVVWLDSEGSNWVVANSIDDFAAMLPYSTGTLFDFGYSCDNHDSNDADSTHPEAHFTSKRLKQCLSEAKEAYERHDELMKWLKSFGIKLDPNPLATIGEAQKRHSGFRDWIQKHL